jgi:hypothetical protein
MRNDGGAWHRRRLGSEREVERPLATTEDVRDSLVPRYYTGVTRWVDEQGYTHYRAYRDGVFLFPYSLGPEHPAVYHATLGEIIEKTLRGEVPLPLPVVVPIENVIPFPRSHVASA